MDNPFGQQTTDPPTIVARIMHAVEDECRPGHCQIAPMLERCARDAVDEMWDSRVKTFVPLLAMRRVRGCIRAGTCDRGADD